jgi:hypothetical protein
MGHALKRNDEDPDQESETRPSNLCIFPRRLRFVTLTCAATRWDTDHAQNDASILSRQPAPTGQEFHLFRILDELTSERTSRAEEGLGRDAEDRANVDNSRRGRAGRA